MDPIEIALAADQAAQQMVNVVGKPTVINLFELDERLSPYNIMLFAFHKNQFEGYFDIDEHEDFWLSLPTDGSPIILRFDDGENPILVDRSPYVSIPAHGKYVAVILTHSKQFEPTSNTLVDFWMELQWVGNDVTRVYFTISTSPIPPEFTFIG